MEALHWFKRSEGYDLFGEERGQISLGNILTIRVLDDDPSMFEMQGIDTKKRVFQAPSNAICEEWVTAIRSAIKLSVHHRRAGGRRGSLAGIKNIEADEREEAENSDVSVLFISVISATNHNEVVIARQPEWGRVIAIPLIGKDDKIVISLANGGIVRMPFDMLQAKSEEGAEFEAPIQNVKLASSLRITLQLEAVNLGSMGNFAGRKRHEGKLNTVDMIADMAISLSNDRTTAINLVLSMMVIVVALASLRSIGVDTTLLFLFAALLSGYNCNLILQRVYAGESDAHRKISVRMILHGHAFTSPDAPIKEAEDNIPQRFIDGCNGDMKEARRRWDITRHWREAEGINHILEEPQPHFSLIKSMYPHYNCGRGREGHTIFWERAGEFQAPQLAARGLRIDELVRHWLFCTEYQWEVLCKGDQTAKSIAVLDAKGVSMSDLAGSNMDYIKKTVGIANLHYPERSHIIYVINAPYYASWGWKLLKPLVHENTQKKVRILSPSETLKGLQEHIDISQIPEFYGGQLDFGGHDSCRFNCPEAVAMDEFVRRLNGEEVGSPTQNSVPFSPQSGDAPADAADQDSNDRASPRSGDSNGNHSNSNGHTTNASSSSSTAGDRRHDSLSHAPSQGRERFESLDHLDTARPPLRRNSSAMMRQPSAGDMPPSPVPSDVSALSSPTVDLRRK